MTTVHERSTTSRRKASSTPERPTRSAAAQRALERRRRRLEREGDALADERRSNGKGSPGTVRIGPSRLQKVRRLPFAVPVLALLVVGLGLSLWLSTKAAQDSYRLGIERAYNQTLSDKRDSLKRSYESGASAPELSDKAAKQGMIPARNPARMVVGPDGKPRIVGEVAPADGKPLESINPADEPDPLAGIDASKVDDSTGLPNSSGPDSSGPSADDRRTPEDSDAPEDAERDGDTAGDQDAPAAPEGARQDPAPPAPGAPTASPNVLPQGDPPTPNAGQAR